MFLIHSLTVVDLGFSKGGFWFCKSSAQNELKTEKSKTSISKHSKFNLASSNTSNLTQLTSTTWKANTLTTKRGRGTTF